MTKCVVTIETRAVVADTCIVGIINQGASAGWLIQHAPCNSCKDSSYIDSVPERASVRELPLVLPDKLERKGVGTDGDPDGATSGTVTVLPSNGLRDFFVRAGNRTEQQLICVWVI